MICVLKHVAYGKYLTGATGSLRNIGSKVQLHLTSKIADGKLIENPNYDYVIGWGCEVIPVKFVNGRIVQDGTIYNSTAKEKA